jgi:hypothetical protein
LQGQAVSGPWKLIWDVPAEASDGNLNQLLNAARNNEMWSDDFTAVQEQRIEIQQPDLPYTDETEVVPVLAGLTDHSRTRLNPKTIQIYGAGLQSMNIDSITTIQDILTQKGNGIMCQNTSVPYAPW